MNENTLHVILDGIQDIRNNQHDMQQNQLQDIRERLAKVETILNERTDGTKELQNMIKSHDDRLSELENHAHTTIGAKEIVAWLVVVGIMAWEAFK